METARIDGSFIDAVAPLIAEFRVVLSSFRGGKAELDIGSAREEFEYFLDKGYPMFAAVDGGELVGYVVCRTDGPCLWVEHLFVREDRRRQGAGSMLFEKAEELAEAMGGDTVFNFVHPNNERVIGFLRSKGYTVLNLIEIRKPYEGETPSSTVRVGNNVFDY